MTPDPTVPPTISPSLPKKFPRGAKPTPRHKLAAARPFIPLATLLAPTQFAAIPKQLSMWCNGPEGNYDVSGDCVSAEEAFAKAAYSVMLGLPEVFVPPPEVERWAQAGGFWDGANLTDVMDAMKVSGFNVGGVNYTDGGYQSVDYSNETVLQAALLQGPVKLGLDADALPGTAGNQQGWYAIGGTPGQFTNEDHCTGLCAFGSAEWLYQQLYAVGLIASATVPSALVGKTGYLFFTWSSIGFVDHAWLMSTVGEAWVRNPTTPGQGPAPVPTPTPVPMPTPPAPTPTPVVQQFAITGTSTGSFFSSTKQFTGTATSIPAHFHAVKVGTVSWFSAIMDVLALVSDVRAKNYNAVVSDVENLITDLGITLPFALKGKVTKGIADIAVSNVVWGNLLSDAVALFQAITSFNLIAIQASVTQLLTDLGFTNV